MLEPNAPRLRTVAVVLAGGTGTRMGLPLPKQLVTVAGRTILEHTVTALNRCAEVDEILIMMAVNFIQEAEAILLHRPDLAKVTRILPGGTERTDSTRAALAALGPEECNVLFHDAVRPLVSPRIVRECVGALKTEEAVLVAIPSADSVMQVDDQNRVVAVPDRKYLRRGQTPQGFRLSVIRRAYAIAATDAEIQATEDCGVVMRYLPQVPIHIVPGSEQNFKITYPVDLSMLETVLQLRSSGIEHVSLSACAATLRGRAVVVIGGSRGIGADVVRCAADAGCRVFPLSRSTTGAQIQDIATIEAALAQVASQTGRIDAVILCVAPLVTGPLASLGQAAIVHALNINLLGPMMVAQASEPHLRRTQGHLVLCTSAASAPDPIGHPVHAATKAARVALAKSLAQEWSDDGIHVNILSLGENGPLPFGEGAQVEYNSEAIVGPMLSLLVSKATGQVIDVHSRNHLITRE